MTKPGYPTLAEATRIWARIGLLSFGGPAGQIALMHRILVEEQKWLGERRFLHALNYCMLLPGPEAQQLAVYIGWLMHRTLGGIIAGVLFVLPGMVAIMGLSWIYAIWGNVGIVQGMFFGLKAAVLAIVVQAVIRIGRRALGNGAMLLIAAASFLAIFVFGVPFPLIVLAAGLIGYAGSRAGWAAFQGGGGHGRLGACRSPMPIRCWARRRPAMRRSIAAGRCASRRCCWRCGWCRWRCFTCWRGRRMSSARSPASSAPWRW